MRHQEAPLEDRAFPPIKVGIHPCRRGKTIDKGQDTPTPRSDEWTLALLQVRDSQDQAAFVRLFNHFAPRIKSYLMKSGAPDGLADDATQEALAAVWHKARLFNPASASASTWIFTIARNKNIDAIRKQKRPEPEDISWLEDQEEDAFKALETTQEEAGLRGAVAKLPDSQRAIIEQAFYGDMSHSEIATKTGIPLGTIKSRIRLGLARIRHELTRAK